MNPEVGTFLVFDVLEIGISANSDDHRSSGIFRFCKTIRIKCPSIVVEVTNDSCTAVLSFPKVTGVI
jgi:hypothetical protein